MSTHRRLFPVYFAILSTLPGFVVYLFHISLTPPMLALISGTAILGSSFLLLWACDAVQADISAGLALAIVALVAVLPEYAVDMYFTWQAGQQPNSEYASYAIANMTGANRLLIGVAWTSVAAIYWLKHHKHLFISPERRTEIVFLAMATLYALIIPIKGSLCWYDGIVFLSIYVAYIIITGRRPRSSCEAVGPAEILINFDDRKRRFYTISMFLFAGVAILANARPFSESLIGTGALLHVNKFLLVQWLAPLASEAPEFIVAIMFALRGRADLALGSLISSKLNQWTLLVGMIPGVYAVSAGTLAHPIPLNTSQMHEIMLTAAQSLLAIVIIANLRFTIGQAGLLFILFMGQFLAPEVVKIAPQLVPWSFNPDQLHQLFSLLYIVSAVVLLLDDPSRLRFLRKPFSCACSVDMEIPEDETEQTLHGDIVVKPAPPGCEYDGDCYICPLQKLCKNVPANKS